jgi:hypothetical protein
VSRHVISLHYIPSSIRLLAIMVVMETGSCASPESGILSTAPPLSLASSVCFKYYLPSCFWLKLYFGEQLLVARYQMWDRRPALESNRYPFLRMITRGCASGLPGCYKMVVGELRGSFCCWLVIRRVGYSESVEYSWQVSYER